MDFNFSPEDEAFRREFRAWLEVNAPRRDSAPSADVLAEADEGEWKRSVAWYKKLASGGWTCINWPREYGGRGASILQTIVYNQELARAHAPLPVIGFGPGLLGPTLMHWGTEDQKKRYIPKIISGEEVWCQGYSEPGSGSDLASLRTAAVRDGDDYVVNGQKTWNTLGQYADWIFCLVRTQSSGRPQEGISFLLIDMKTPGVSVRPIITIDGEHEINDIFFDNVRVPARNRVGEENRGWTYAKFLLSHERTNTAGIGSCKRALARLKQLASTQKVNGRPLLDEPRFRDQVARVELELTALEITNLRVLSAMSGEGAAPGPEVSALKIKGSEVIQRLAELQMHALGPAAVSGAGEASLAAQYFNMRKTTIYAGSSEIQKNIISKLVLGL